MVTSRKWTRPLFDKLFSALKVTFECRVALRKGKTQIIKFLSLYSCYTISCMFDPFTLKFLVSTGPMLLAVTSLLKRLSCINMVYFYHYYYYYVLKIFNVCELMNNVNLTSFSRHHAILKANQSKKFLKKLCTIHFLELLCFKDNLQNV